MSITSGLNASVAGLGVNTQRLAAISDNIANSNTPGYRRTETTFSSLVSDAGSGYSAGGVASMSFKEVGSPGALISSGNATDLAVAGPGLLPASPLTAVGESAAQRPLHLLPTGTFRQNEDGYLVTPGGMALLGWPTDAQGDPGSVVRESAGSMEPVRLSAYLTSAQATTYIDLGMNLPADATAPFLTDLEYFDALGAKHTLTFQFTQFSSMFWHINVYDSASAPPGMIAELDLAFAINGSNAGRISNARVSTGNPVDPNGPGTTASYDAATGQATVNVADGPVFLQIARGVQSNGLTRFAAPFSANGIEKNGAPAGNLESVEIDAAGVLSGVYDTGQRLALYQIPLGLVPDPNAMTALDGQAFAVSPDSGSVFFHDSGPGPAGEIVGRSLQQSTVDIARELTDMIVTQRSFSSNATAIRTADEMLQEVTSLKR